MNTCAMCKYFQFKCSAQYSWGQCLHPDILNRRIMYFSPEHVDEVFQHPDPEKLRQALQDYGRIYIRENAFGCILHKPVDNPRV